jgi:GNAT superfamily N-acetyltransferase
MTTSSRQMTPHARGVTRIGVDVTFLRLDPGPAVPPSPALPSGDVVVRATRPSVGFYRYLYDTVGHDYCWWLRRVCSDAELSTLLADPAIAIYVLYRDGEPAGFFELDGRGAADINLSYFGLFPHAVGTGAGPALLGVAARLASAGSTGGVVRVNTCTADHPRAMQTDLRAGFRPLRTVRETWDIPDRLGLPIPARLRV